MSLFLYLSFDSFSLPNTLRLQMYCFFLIYANFPAIFDILRLLYSLCFIFFVLCRLPVGFSLLTSNRRGHPRRLLVVRCSLLAHFCASFLSLSFFFSRAIRLPAMYVFPAYLVSCPVTVYTFSPRRMYICPSRRMSLLLSPP